MTHHPEQFEILRVLVGSRAHGIADEESDYDYRSVFIYPTAEILRLGPKLTETGWVEGTTEDDTSYELGHFLRLATHSNPLILEVFAAPVIRTTHAGNTLRSLFPHVWGSKDVWDSFTGYAANQRKKMMDDPFKDRKRWTKFAVAYARVLRQGEWLLKTGDMMVELPEYWRPFFTKLRAGDEITSMGQIIDQAGMIGTSMWEAYQKYDPGAGGTPKLPDIEKANRFLLGVRRQAWTENDARQMCEAK